VPWNERTLLAQITERVLVLFTIYAVVACFALFIAVRLYDRALVESVSGQFEVMSNKAHETTLIGIEAQLMSQFGNLGALIDRQGLLLIDTLSRKVGFEVFPIEYEDELIISLGEMRRIKPTPRRWMYHKEPYQMNEM
jgi:hypothetical protein